MPAAPLSGIPTAKGRAALRRIRAGLGAFAALASLGGCASSNYPYVSVPSANQQLAGGYRLGTGDKVKVTVFDEPALTGEYDIGANGTMAMPLIAEVPAQDLTPAQVAQTVARKLAEGGYVLAPRVAVEVIKYRPFYIMGEVNKPGEYAYTGQLSLLQAIALAGGFTARADKGSVVVRRNSWPTPHRVRVDDAPLLVAPGDTVVVPEAFF